jgi:hypothetical protein
LEGSEDSGGAKRSDWTHRPVSMTDIPKEGTSRGGCAIGKIVARDNVNLPGQGQMPTWFFLDLLPAASSPVVRHGTVDVPLATWKLEVFGRELL